MQNNIIGSPEGRSDRLHPEYSASSVPTAPHATKGAWTYALPLRCCEEWSRRRDRSPPPFCVLSFDFISISPIANCHSHRTTCRLPDTVHNNKYRIMPYQTHCSASITELRAFLHIQKTHGSGSGRFAGVYSYFDDRFKAAPLSVAIVWS